jgi:hypothetical protein
VQCMGACACRLGEACCSIVLEQGHTLLVNARERACTAKVCYRGVRAVLRVIGGNLRSCVHVASQGGTQRWNRMVLLFS